MEDHDYNPYWTANPMRSYVSGEGNKELFTGKELDEGTGLSYFGARYYDPGIGRFLSVDRFAEKYSFMTPYQYAANNPLLFIDINGDSINVSGLEGETRRNFITTLKNLSGYTFRISQNGNLIITSDGDASSQSFRYVVTSLLSSENIYNTSYNFDLGVPALYDPTSRTLYLSDVKSVNSISHEYFHAFQHENNVLNRTTETESSAFLFSNVVSYEHAGT